MRRLGLALLCSLSIVCLRAQKAIVPQHPFRMNADYAVFRQTDTTVRIELFLGFSSRLTTFEFRDQQYRGTIKIGVSITDRSSQRMLLRETSMLPIVLPDTTRESFQTNYVTRFSYALLPGDYVLGFEAKDSLGVGRIDTLSIAVVVPPMPSTTHISGLELSSSISESQATENPFYKNGYEVVPNPGLLFGAGSAPVAFCYAELYNLDTTTAYKVTVKIVDRAGTVQRSRDRYFTFRSNSVVDISSTNMTSLASGRYRFQLILADTLGQEFSRSEKQLFVYNPQLETTPVTSSSARIAEFAGMSFDELADEFRKSRYLSLPSDDVAFGKLTTADARRQYLAQYWTEIEEGKKGRKELTRGLYLRRVTAANQRFRSLGKEGWLTDRGRIYLLYAEPDEIQRYPSSDNSKPYEIWQYYQIENGVQFVFVDRSGFGDYILVHSTLRGELRDEQWQQQLQ